MFNNVIGHPDSPFLLAFLLPMILVGYLKDDVCCQTLCTISSSSKAVLLLILVTK